MSGGATAEVSRDTARAEVTGARRLLTGVAVTVLPLLAGLYVGATTFGGTLLPWRPVMVDLEVYRQAGGALLAGQDVYDLPGQLPFLYPPLAALLAVPLSLLPATLVQVAWTAAGVLALLAVIHRFGLTGWRLSLVGAGAVVVVEPVSQTLAFGQLGIFLVALVVLDLVPGPRVLSGRRRLLPEGALTALAAAIKLTPAIFVLYLLAVRRWRPAVAAVITGALVTLAAAAVVPGPSLTFWGRLARGDTGLGHSLIYYTNQSVMADVVRVVGLGSGAAALGLLLSALVAGLGVWAGAAWHRRGDVGLAVVVVGMAGLLASPVSWLHHFVWIVPLGLVLLDRLRPVTTAGGRTQPLPAWFQAWGWVIVGWVIVAPFRRLPNGADLELTWTWDQHLLASVTAVLGVGWLLAALVVARRPAPGGPAVHRLPA
ncbi:MAG: glycosyltransferase 87 family protein [Actinomycetes bacterium]